MDLGQLIVIVLSLILGMWFFLGAVVNRRIGVATFNWLSLGVESLGKLSEAKWIGSSGSGARLVIAKAQAPFQRIELVFLLESREILPLWIFNHLRGKRDEMIIKAGLRSVPSQEIEAAWEGDRQLHKLLDSTQKKPFEKLPESPTGYEIASRGQVNSTTLDHLKSFLERFPDSVRRVSLQRTAPHLILQVNLPSLRREPAGDFFAALRLLME